VPTRRIKLLLVAIALVATTYLALGAQMTDKPKEDLQAQLAKRGKYLVFLGGCNDCHSPKVFTAQGPIPDTTKLLSGAPADNNIPAVPTGVLAPDKWGFLGSNDMTTWAGPWE